MKIFVAGIGPGEADDITPAVLKAVADSDVIVGYKYYFQFVQHLLRPGAQCIDTGMRKERERAQMAFDYAQQGHTVCVISSGDAGIYGMAPLIYEMKSQLHSDVQVVCLPGISAFQKAAALLGAPVGHDFCVISLSDLMTPWQVIENRIVAAAQADFVTAIYNPKSSGRYWQLHRLKEIFLQHRDPNTVVGSVRQAGRPDQHVAISSLLDFDPETVDMFTVVIIGNSQSYQDHDLFVTPRGYYRQQALPEESQGVGVGQSIMIESFRTICGELANPDLPVWHLWTLLHVIHTTADFDMQNLLWMDPNATADVFQMVRSGRIKTIVTDVTMVASGIRKGALSRLGLEVVCYINDPEVVQMAKENNITRAQAAVSVAARNHQDALFVFGNAPTALLQLCDLVRKGKCLPAAIVAAPVGFVHVLESKHAVKSLSGIPKFIIQGRKGGSNVAATIVNSILTYDDADLLMPGRDV